MGVYPAVLARVTGAGFKVGLGEDPVRSEGQVQPIGFGTIMVMDKAKNREAGLGVRQFIGLEATNGAFWNISFGQLPPRLSFREDPPGRSTRRRTRSSPAYVEAQKSTDLPYYGPGARRLESSR